MAVRWTKERSANAHAAKARLRMARPAPEYPPMLDYDSPVETWTIQRHSRNSTHQLVLFHSRRRRSSFRVVVDGAEKYKCIGYDKLMRLTVKSLSRQQSQFTRLVL